MKTLRTTKEIIFLKEHEYNDIECVYLSSDTITPPVLAKISLFNNLKILSLSTSNKLSFPNNLINNKKLQIINMTMCPNINITKDIFDFKNLIAFYCPNNYYIYEDKMFISRLMFINDKNKIPDYIKYLYVSDGRTNNNIFDNLPPSLEYLQIRFINNSLKNLPNNLKVLKLIHDDINDFLHNIEIPYGCKFIKYSS